MVNKKIILSILAIGMLATVVGAGTWAYYQDSITVADSAVTTGSITMLFDSTVTGASAEVTGASIPSALPGDSGVIGVTHSITNTGTDAADIYFKVTGTIPTGVTLTVGGADVTVDTITPLESDITSASSAVDATIEYNYENTDVNQNSEEAQTGTFDVIYYMVPADETVTEE